MAGFLCLDTICDPNGGPATIAWVLAFLGFPPPTGIPGSLKGFGFTTFLGWFAAAAPGENLKRNDKTKGEQKSIGV